MKVKGTLISGTMHFIKTYFGESGLKAVIKNLTEDERKVLGISIPSSMWYSYELYHNLSKAAIDHFYDGDVTKARLIGEFTAIEYFKSPYRIHVKLGTPEIVVNKAPKVFSGYFDEGEMILTEQATGKLFVEVRDIPLADKLFAERISGWMAKIIEICGGKNVKVENEIIERDSKRVIVFRGRWEK